MKIFGHPCIPVTPSFLIRQITHDQMPTDRSLPKREFTSFGNNIHILTTNLIYITIYLIIYQNSIEEFNLLLLL